MQLESFIESTLLRAGSVVEPGPAGFEALLAPAAAAALGVDEQVRLHLGASAQAGAIAAGYGTSFLRGLCSLARSSPKRYRLELECAPPKPERVERDAQAACAFRNATGRLASIEHALLKYTVVDFRYTATSDDKAEGLLSVAVSGTERINPRLPHMLGSFLGMHPEARREWHGGDEPWPVEACLETAIRSARAPVRDETRAFAARMERRMARDLRRVEEYFGALLAEVGARRRGPGQSPEKIQAKLEAIQSEQRRRLQDIQHRYTVTLGLEPIAMLALRIRGPRIGIEVRRKRTVRVLELGWNPVTRELDCWLCARCGRPAPAPRLCEALHPICGECPPECPLCDRATQGVRDSHRSSRVRPV